MTARDGVGVGSLKSISSDVGGDASEPHALKINNAVNKHSTDVHKPDAVAPSFLLKSMLANSHLHLFDRQADLILKKGGVKN